MYLRHYLVYIRAPRNMVLASPLPERAAARYAGSDGDHGSWVIDRPFPAWLAYDLAGQALSALAEMPEGGDRRRELRAVFQRRLRRWGRPAGIAWERLRPLPAESNRDWGRVLEALEGKILFSAEVESYLRGSGEVRGVEPVLSELAAAGLIEARPAVEILHFGRAVCRRCGELDLEQEDCWLCGDRKCWACPSCRHLGAATGCRVLYARPGSDRIVPRAPAVPVFPFPLTAAQERTVASLRSFLAGGGGEFLLWAVCGAGKTEVILAGISEALARGDRILLATPRRDVAGELAAKARAAYPNLRLSVHHGGRHEDDDGAAITVATTHQCLRYYRAFDLAILDEVDAFPYQGSRMLYEAVARARRPGGSIVYLTATPTSALEERARAGELAYARLPVRPHGHPLPVPLLLQADLGPAGPGWMIPRALRDLLAAAVPKRPVLVFVPSVAAAAWIGQALTEWGKGEGLRAGWVHAADKARERKKEAFARGELDLLVTTTLLERGLNLGSLDVFVLFAEEEEIFDRAALVQIAGRAGRRADDPDGRVLFIGRRISRAMKSARDLIVEANAEAEKQGYLIVKNGARERAVAGYGGLGC